MSKLWKRLVAGLLMAACAGGAAVAVAPPALLIPPAAEAGEANACPACVLTPACCATVSAEPSECCKTTNCGQSAECCKDGVCKTDCCSSGCCKSTVACCAPTMGVSLEWSGPSTARVNRPAEYTLTARNVCGKPVQRVTVQVKVPASVDVTAVMPAAKAVDGVYVWDVGTLAAGDAVPLTVTMASPNRGDLGCEAWVTCTGTAAMTVPVVEPKLEVAIKAPKAVVIGSKYTVEYAVTNVGDAAAETVNCVTGYMANADIKNPGTETINTLSAGETRMISAEYRATTAGNRTHGLTAASADGLHAAATARTIVEGVPALRMEVVDLADPIEKGSETTYEIRVTNTGTAPDANVTVACPLPGRLQMVSATGPTGVSAIPTGGVTHVRFDPIRELAPKTEAVFRITVKAVGSGDVRFAAHLTSANLTTSVTSEESTRVYGE